MVNMKVVLMAFAMILMLAAMPASVQAQSETGLVGEWLFDGDAKDSSGNGNDGTIYGASFVEGKFGKALSFDGVNDYVRGSDNLFPSGNNPRTLLLWAKPIVDNKRYYIAFAYGTRTINQMSSIGIYDNPQIWYISQFGGIVSGDVTHTDVWTFLAFTFDGATYKLYENAVLTGSGTMDTNTVLNIFYIGKDEGGWFFNGLIDEVRIYNRALSADEIKELYEGDQTALSITKSASPTSIKQGQTTAITLSVKNTGTTEIKDIEIKDTLPADVTYVSGETSKTYSSLMPKDSREFQYVVQINQAGTFNLNPAAATFADAKGNYHSAKSNTVAIEVIQSFAANPPPTSAATAALSVKKEASPYSIRQYQTTTVSIKIINGGTSEIKDVEVIDTIKPNFDLISGDFPNPKKYSSVSAGESRELQYILKPKESGSFNLGTVTVSYADEKGNIKVISSEPISLTVVPSTQGDGVSISAAQTSKTASVSLHGEKTDVVMGEDILLRLSAVNLITKPKMHVQVIIIPPSGMSVTSSEFSKSAAGQFTANYQLEPGDGKDIEVRIRSNQVGDFNVNGRIIYYFGNDIEKAEDQTLNLPIKVRKEPGEPAPFDPTPKAPGFAGELAIIGILFVALLIKRRR